MKELLSDEKVYNHTDAWLMDVGEEEIPLQKRSNDINCCTVILTENLILPKPKQLLQWRCRKEYKIGIHYQRSVEGLSPAESEASHILSEFADVFSKGPHDLGGTNLLKHCIDT